MGIVEEARQWLGVKFQHQGRSKFGVDCAGLVICVGQSLGVFDPLFNFSDYDRNPNGDYMYFMAQELLDEIQLEEAKEGDILMFKFAYNPQHLGFRTDNGVIHSYQAAGEVVEHAIDDVWNKRLFAAFRFKRS